MCDGNHPLYLVFITQKLDPLTVVYKRQRRLQNDSWATRHHYLVVSDDPFKAEQLSCCLPESWIRTIDDQDMVVVIYPRRLTVVNTRVVIQEGLLVEEG